MAKSFEEYLKEIQEEESNKKQYDEALAANQKVYDTQKQQVTDNYNQQIGKVDSEYQQLFDENAVQKLINEREVAENMANLGLTDSGLNRTQQTAVQLSYANNKGKYSLAKQQALDELSLSLANAVSELDVNKAQSDQSIKDTWDTNNRKYAVEMYNADVEAEAEKYKADLESATALQQAQIEAASKLSEQNTYVINTSGGALSFSYQGSFADNNVYKTDNGNGTVTYYDENSGKQTTLKKTQNPYTLDDNSQLIELYGAFDNGYQYKGVNGVGAFVKNKKGNVESAGKIDFYGEGEINRTQNVFKTKTNGKIRYWTWNGSTNSYMEVEKVGDSGWKIISK